MSNRSPRTSEGRPDGGESPPPTEEAAGRDPDLGQAGGVFGQAVLGLARVLARRGRDEARRAALTGRLRLDLRQLRKDRDAMYAKLGREVRHLVEGGELSHPGVQRGIERIAELEKRIRALEGELAAVGEQDPDPAGEERTTPTPGESAEGPVAGSGA